VPGLYGGGTETFNGLVTKSGHLGRSILAEEDWDGTMHLRSDVSWGLSQAAARTDPIPDPVSPFVLLHELSHGNVSAAEAGSGEDEDFYQAAPQNADIEEGVTNVGAILRAGDFFDQMGIGDLPVKGQNGLTMRQLAEESAKPDVIKAGRSWPIYHKRTQAAYRWLEDLAKAEGTPAAKLPQRVRELADEMNRLGAAGKARYVARADRRYGIKWGTGEPAGVPLEASRSVTAAQRAEQIIAFAWADPQANAAEAQRRIIALAEANPGVHEVTDAGTMIARLVSAVARKGGTQ
jgi:hypothetical protein